MKLIDHLSEVPKNNYPSAHERIDEAFRLIATLANGLTEIFSLLPEQITAEVNNQCEPLSKKIINIQEILDGLQRRDRTEHVRVTNLYKSMHPSKDPE
jgi:hypothetical protein